MHNAIIPKNDNTAFAKLPKLSQPIILSIISNATHIAIVTTVCLTISVSYSNAQPLATNKQSLNTLIASFQANEKVMTSIMLDAAQATREASLLFKKLEDTERLKEKSDSKLLSTYERMIEGLAAGLVGYATKNEKLLQLAARDVVRQAIKVATESVSSSKLSETELALHKSALEKLKHAQNLIDQVERSRSQWESALEAALRNPAPERDSTGLQPKTHENPNGLWTLNSKGLASTAILNFPKGDVSSIEISCKGPSSLSYKFISRASKIKEIDVLASYNSTPKITLDESGVITQGAGPFVNAIDMWETAYESIVASKNKQESSPFHVDVLLTSNESNGKKISLELGGMTSARNDLRRLCAGIPADMMDDHPEEISALKQLEAKSASNGSSRQVNNDLPIVGIWEGVPSGYGLPKRFTFTSDGKFISVTQAYIGSPIGESGSFSLRTNEIFFSYVTGRNDVCQFDIQGSAMYLRSCSSLGKYTKIGMPEKRETAKKAAGINNVWVASLPVLTAEITFNSDGSYSSKWAKINFGSRGRYEVSGKYIIFDSKTPKTLRCEYIQTAETLEIKGPCGGTIVSQGNSEFVGNYRIKK